jgi:hypothetical protein
LRSRLGITPAEYESVLRLIASGFDTSIGRYLAE